jgi:hypothetical protein
VRNVKVTNPLLMKAVSLSKNGPCIESVACKATLMQALTPDNHCVYLSALADGSGGARGWGSNQFERDVASKRFDPTCPLKLRQFWVGRRCTLSFEM